ncbi:gag-pol polyprotein [Tanacetum coccineum]
MAAKFEIEKFNGNNFSLWKLKMKAILRKDKCLASIGERPAEVTDDSKWDEMDGNAIANLHLALADGVLSSIEEKKSAKEIWDHLARLYEERSLHNKKFLKRKLYALRMTESTSVIEHVNNLNTLFSQLTSLSCKIDSQERAEILLQNLPDSYDQVIINLTSNFRSNDSFEAAPQHEVNEKNKSQALATRTLNRERRRPGWHLDYVMESNVAYCLLTDEGEPSTLQEALNNPDASFWKEAMQEEIEAPHKNKTWELVTLPGGRKPIGNKWVYKINKNGDDQVERYRARLVVKGYAQKEGIDFNEKFSPVVRMTTIRVVLAMCATYDLHLEQLYVKTVFLHGNLVRNTISQSNKRSSVLKKTSVS